MPSFQDVQSQPHASHATSNPRPTTAQFPAISEYEDWHRDHLSYQQTWSATSSPPRPRHQHRHSEGRDRTVYKRRISIACERCRQRKIKCSEGGDSGNEPCQPCLRAGEDRCTFVRAHTIACHWPGDDTSAAAAGTKPSWTQPSVHTPPRTPRRRADTVGLRPNTPQRLLPPIPNGIALSSPAVATPSNRPVDSGAWLAPLPEYPIADGYGSWHRSCQLPAALPACYPASASLSASPADSVFSPFPDLTSVYPHGYGTPMTDYGGAVGSPLFYPDSGYGGL